MQATFLDDHIDVEHAREHGHMHLSEVKIHMLTLPSHATEPYENCEHRHDWWFSH